MARLRELSRATLHPVARRLWRFESRALCEAARRRTGLEDFGEPPIEPALSHLAESLEREANLHPLGRLLMRIHLRGLLETRLKLVAAWTKERRALEEQRIGRPLFIVGMPRSGSTFLHELLSEDPANCAPRIWQVMFPVPAPGPGKRGEAQRIRKTARCLWWFRRLAPQADAVYPMRALTPHECVAIQSYTFLSEEFISTCRVPRYEAFLRGTDLAPAYAWQKRFLQYLQLGQPAKRWMLKSPDHVYGLEKLFAVFPDAHIVQTHRNPVEVLKSSADLTRVLRGLYGPPGEPGEIAAREARLLADNTERFIQFRDTHLELASRFIDVRYTDLIADPVTTVRHIYRHLESPLADEAAQRMQRLASARSRYHGLRTGAQPSGFSHTALEIHRFERYCSRFGLPFYEADQR